MKKLKLVAVMFLIIFAGAFVIVGVPRYFNTPSWVGSICGGLWGAAVAQYYLRTGRL